MAAPRTLLRVELDQGDLDRIARDLGRTSSTLYREVGDEMVTLIRSLIRSRTGQLAGSWKHRRVANRIVFTSRTPYSFASVKGAFIKPKSKRALKFEVAGRTTFAKTVRFAPGAYRGRARGARSSKSYLDDASDAFGLAAERAWSKTVAKELNRTLSFF